MTEELLSGGNAAALVVRVGGTVRKPLFDGASAFSMNSSATARVLDRFAADPFWSVRIAVVEHENTERGTLLRLLEEEPRQRGVVHHAARKRLEAEGIEFGANGMPRA
ncbi:hypothetical protein EXU48_10640 [Occultella glacieicola]|uniref:Uncharacterized protein n=1 Tax=Occultella glacieicola TaxID=2518684 RepID=A0ABY2E3Y2_9MICO|nr:hypothetical protein [Occultella glacieicola]TDE93918.1 hypothetical protein EXU48_10640 [Occultella glacieicola]